MATPDHLDPNKFWGEYPADEFEPPESSFRRDKPARTVKSVTNTTAPDFLGARVPESLAELMKHGYHLRQVQHNDGSFTTYLVDPAGNDVAGAMLEADQAMKAASPKAFEDAVFLEHRKALHKLDGYAREIAEREANKAVREFMDKPPGWLKASTHLGFSREYLDYADRTAKAKTPDIVADIKTMNDMIMGRFPAPANRLATLKRECKEGFLPPGYSEYLPDEDCWFEVSDDVDGSRHWTMWAGNTTRGKALSAAALKGGKVFVSEENLGDSKEILCKRAAELAAQLSRDLRHDKSLFKELKEGGTLARDVVIVVAGQRISVTLQLDGLGEEKGIMP